MDAAHYPLRAIERRPSDSEGTGGTAMKEIEKRYRLTMTRDNDKEG
jgi:hypothetical protein